MKDSKEAPIEQAAARLKWALEYRGLGWSIAATRPGSNEPEHDADSMECQKNGLTDEIAEKWWGNGADRGIVVTLGGASDNLVAISFQTATDYNRWAQDNSDVGGRCPTMELGNRRVVFLRSADPWKGKFTGGRLHGPGQEIQLPPSRLHNGTVLWWSIEPNGQIPKISSPADAGIVVSTGSISEVDEPGGMGGASRVVLSALQDPVKSKTLKGVVLLSAREEKRLIEATAYWCPKKFMWERVGHLIRGAKAFPKLAAANPRDLRPLTAKWCAVAFGRDDQDVVDFVQDELEKSWGKMNVPLITEFMEIDLRNARPKSTPACIPTDRGPAYKLFARFCREMASWSGDGTFVMSSVKAAGVLGYSQELVSTRLRRFCAADPPILELIEKGNFYAYKVGHYRWAGGDR